MASWLLVTVGFVNYFGCFLERGQGLIGSALGACFCLFLNAFRLKGESIWLSCIYQQGLIQARNVLLSVQKPHSWERRGRNIPSQPSASLCLLASSPHWQRCLCWSAVSRLESAWTYGPQYFKNNLKNLCCFYYSRCAHECCPYCNFMLLSCKK